MMFHSFHSIILAIFYSGLCCTFCFAQAPMPIQPATPPLAAPAPASDKQPDLAMMMAFMKPDTIVMRVGTMTLSWQELQPLTKQFTQPNSNAPANDSTAVLRSLLQRMALRGLYLQEAIALDIRVSDEQRKANDELLEQGLRDNAKGITKDDIKKSFSTDHSTLTKLTENDAQRVVTYGNQFLAEITVSDDDITRQLMATKAVREALAKQNDVTRTQILELLKNPDSQTDEGFARLAKEHSEGIEAKNGGVMNYDFLPSELAKVNQLEHFDLKPGQTSGLLETPTAFRIMRVLSAVPPKNEGDPERFRVAQWLFRKLPEDDGTSREQIRAELLLAKQKLAVAEIGKTLQKKYPVTCIFFPDGLWPEEIHQDQ